MKIIIICIMLMLFGCGSQPSTSIKSNTLPNPNNEITEETTVETTENKEEEKKFLKIEEQYVSGDVVHGMIYFYYDDLGRLIGEESYGSYTEYEYIGDTDKIKRKIMDWATYDYAYNNLGKLASEVSSHEGEVYSDKKYKYHGDLLVEEYIVYPVSNITEIIYYTYEDGVLISKYTESFNNDTYESYSYLEIYTYGVDNEQPATEEYYYNGTQIYNICRNKYKNGLIVKREIVDFLYGTGEMILSNYIEYEYDEYNNLISEKYYYEDEFVSETRYVYEEFK